MTISFFFILQAKFHIDQKCHCNFCCNQQFAQLILLPHTWTLDKIHVSQSWFSSIPMLYITTTFFDKTIHTQPKVKYILLLKDSMTLHTYALICLKNIKIIEKSVFQSKVITLWPWGSDNFFASPVLCPLKKFYWYCFILFFAQPCTAAMFSLCNARALGKRKNEVISIIFLQEGLKNKSV